MTRLPRDVDASTLISALGRAGYRVVRQTGSHIRLETSTRLIGVSIPNHSPLKVGMLHAVLKEVAGQQGLTIADLVKVLNL